MRNSRSEFEPVETKEFFRDRVIDALNRLRLRVKEWTEFYLVDLLDRQVARSFPIETPLALQLHDAKEAHTHAEKFARYRKMGDSALVLAGLYTEYLEAKGVSATYVSTMGGGAYTVTASLSTDGYGPVYVELADGFDDFVRVLVEVRESTISLRTPQDIVRLYDRWRKSGSPALAERLRKEGVYPQGGGDS